MNVLISVNVSNGKVQRFIILIVEILKRLTENIVYR